MSPTARPVIEKANSLYAMGFCDPAVGMLSEALERNPSQLDILKALADLLVDSDQHQAALTILNKSQINFDDASLFMLRAICYLSLGDATSAGRIADRMLELNFLRADALVIKAKIASRCGDLATAEELFGHAVAYKPDCGSAYLGLGLIRIEKDNHTDCLEYFIKAFQISPFSREIALAFHETAVTLGGCQIAEDAFRQALTLQRLNRRLRFLLIDVILRQSKFEEAIVEIESCMVDFGIDDGILAAALSIRKKTGMLRVSEGEKKHPAVSLCMIVKNEEKHLARCLHSAKPVVDEMIIVDTGSIDKTKDIAAAFGAQVFHFQWVNDFSEARNFSLSKASGDWIMVLDADEAISSKSYQELKSIFHAPNQAPAAYSIQTRNYTHHANTFGWKANKGEYPEELATGWFPSDKVRIFNNDSRIRFVNPVHELVEPSLSRLKIPVRYCTIPVHHFGKLDEMKTHTKTKGYINLGRKKLKKNRLNRSAIKELAIQCAHLGKHEEALRLWKEFVKLQPKSAEAYLNIGTACWNLSRYAEAVSFAQKALCLDPMLREAKFNKGIGLLMLGRAEEAKSILQEISDQQPEYPSAQFMFCVACTCLCELGQVGDKIAKMQATAIGPYLSESFLEVAKRLFAASQIKYALRTIEVAVNFNCANDELAALLAHCRGSA